jgi:N-acetylneuraminic acid mutarotase
MYVAAGLRNNYTNVVYRYDPSQDAWQQLPPIPMSSRANGIGFAIGGYGYMGLGYYFGGSSFTYFQDLWRLDTATTFWTRMADFPGEGRAFAAVFVIGDKAYVTGGSSANHIDTWQYRPATNTWTQKADFPGACNARTTAFAIGTTGYIGLGLGVNGGCKEFWAYDTTANSWAKVDSFPGTTRYDAIGFAIGDTGFVVGGVSNPDSATDVWIYRASANAWSQLPTTYPGPALMQMVAAVIAGRIFVGTGTNSDTGGPDSRFADFWEYIR